MRDCTSKVVILSSLKYLTRPSPVVTKHKVSVPNETQQTSPSHKTKTTNRDARGDDDTSLINRDGLEEQL
jgi:hypothetical protein